MTIASLRRAVALAVVALLFLATHARPDEIRVMTSGGFTAAYLELVPEFERRTGHTVITSFGTTVVATPAPKDDVGPRRSPDLAKTARS